MVLDDVKLTVQNYQHSNRKVEHREVQELIKLNFNFTMEFPQDSVK